MWNAQVYYKKLVVNNIDKVEYLSFDNFLYLFGVTKKSIIEKLTSSSL